MATSNEHRQAPQPRSHRRFLGWLTLLFATGLAIPGCGGAELRPHERAQSQARSTVHGALGSAKSAELREAPYSLKARYNPASKPNCACPDFEVRMYGQWVRVIFEADEPLLEEVTSWSLRREPDEEFIVVATPSGNQSRLADDGQLFNLVEVKAVALP